MKKTKQEILSDLKTVLGEDISNEAIALIEDISDTLDSSEGGSTKELEDKITELENEVKETDEMWKKKYTDRFFNPSPEKINNGEQNEDSEDDEQDTPQLTHFEDLFSTDK